MVLVSLAFAGAARATSASTAIRVANEQRAMTGIPPIVEDDSLLRPECSAESHEIASSETNWSTYENPWTGTAPIHLSRLFDPVDRSAAWGEYQAFNSNDPRYPSFQGTWGCMWFSRDALTAFSMSSQPSFYWSTGGRPVDEVETSLTANEIPETPAGLLGLPQTTGPNLLVYAIGMGASPSIVSASITETGGGSVPVAVLDGHNSEGWILPYYGILVMTHEAKPETAYTATVTWRRSEDGFEATQHFDFKTASKSWSPSGPGGRRPTADLRIEGLRVRGLRVSVQLGIIRRALFSGRLSVVARHGNHPPIQLGINHKLRASGDLEPGRWKIEARYRSKNWRDATVRRSLTIP